ncbi:hypothetical protein CCZ08_25765 [Escherichia coli]|nr:transposase [Escherichia coli]EFA8840181.1 transposase [Escherichia coli O88:H4]EFH9440043.1 hypothetical protein [Escherichia coli]EGI9634402.1 transposase [Escherichia coli]EGK3899812.1 transposase [Escherichia coli]
MQRNAHDALVVIGFCRLTVVFHGDKQRVRFAIRLIIIGADSDVPMMKNAAKTIGKRLYGILNAMRHRVSNGNAEALNSKIRLLRIKARGYRNRERFKLGVMFHYGKLNMAF